MPLLRRWRKLGVTGQIVLLVLVVMVPVFAVDALQIQGRFERHIERETRASVELADAIASAWISHVEGIWSLELAVGAGMVGGGQKFTPEQAGAMLGSQMKEHSTISGMGWLSPDGKLLASSDPRIVGRSFGDREYIRRLIRGEEKTLSDLLTSELTQEPIVVVTRAIRMNGELKGIVLATVDVTRLGDVLAVQRPGKSTFGIVDQNGMIVFRNLTPNLTMEQRKVHPEGPVPRALKGEVATSRIHAGVADNVPRIGGAVPIPGFGWAAYAGSVRAEVLATAWQVTRRDLFLSGAALLFSVAAALWLGRRFAIPILRLQRAAYAMSQGDMTARAGISGFGELADAVKSFDVMAGRIQDMENRLKAKAAQQAEVAALGQMALSGADLDSVFRQALEQMHATLQPSAAAIFRYLPDEESVLLQYGWGWPEGLVGNAKIGARPTESQAGYTIASGRPMIVDNFATEDRFGSKDRVQAYGYTSALSVPIFADGQPWGMLAVYMVGQRLFTKDEAHFLQGVANVLSSAVERRRAEDRRLGLLAAERAARAEGETAGHRLAFLAEASAVLDSSLDLEVTLDNLARLVVQELADWVVIDLAEGDQFRRVAVVHADPRKAADMERLRTEFAPRPGGRHPVQGVIDRGEPLLLPRVPPSILDDIALSAEHRQILDEAGLKTAVVAPLTAHGRILGGISLMRTSDQRPYGEKDLALVLELGSRAGQALENARLYREVQAALAQRDSALEAIEHERARLYELFMQAPAMICIHRGPDHAYALANPLYLSATGNRDLVGKGLLEAFPELQDQGIAELLDRVYQTGEPYEAKERPVNLSRGPAGAPELCYFNFVYQPFRNADGEIDGVDVFAVDVTDQVLARQATERLAETMRRLAERHQALALLNQRFLKEDDLPSTLAWVVTTVRELLRLRGAAIWENSGSVGARPFARAGDVPDSLAATPADGSENPVWLEIEGPDRSYGWLAAYAEEGQSVVEDDLQFLRAVVTTLAVGVQRRGAARRLRLQHAVTRLFAERTTEEQVFPELLQAICQLASLARGSLWLRTDGGPARCAMAWPDHCRKPDGCTLPLDKGMVGMVLTTGEPQWIVNFEGRSDEHRCPEIRRGLYGSGFWLPVSVGGEVVGVLEFLGVHPSEPSDPFRATLQTTAGQLGQFMERTRAKADLHQLNLKLEERVAQRTSELATANHELEAFSYSVSHDLRSPLRTIDGFSQALEEDYNKLLDAQGRSYLQRIRAACQRMGTLIDDLLYLSRVTRSEMVREPTDLTGLARSVAAELQKRFPDRRIDWDIQDGLRAVCDGRLMRAALENLLDNAVKFTGHRPEAEVQFGMELQYGRPVFFVRDNGAGFDMVYADKLFQPFHRLHSPREFEGTGIGLATVQRIIHRHGGSVWALSEPGQGAVFYFTLQARE